MSKGLKPRTHLALDLILFVLLLSVTLSKLFENLIPGRLSHLRFMFHALHGISGILMALVVGIHLFFHWPWIQSQLKRLLQPTR